MPIFPAQVVEAFVVPLQEHCEDDSATLAVLVVHVVVIERKCEVGNPESCSAAALGDWQDEQQILPVPAFDLHGGDDCALSSLDCQAQAPHLVLHPRTRQLVVYQILRHRPREQLRPEGQSEDEDKLVAE